MGLTRGSVVWVDLGAPAGSAPAKRRPVLVLQATNITASAIATVIVAVITSNTRLAELPGNVFLPAGASNLVKDSVVNLSQLVTVSKSELGTVAGVVPQYLLAEVDAGLRKVLSL
jgi:mRNA interferase MazF